MDEPEIPEILLKNEDGTILDRLLASMLHLLRLFAGVSYKMIEKLAPTLWQ